MSKLCKDIWILLLFFAFPPHLFPAPLGQPYLWKPPPCSKLNMSRGSKAKKHNTEILSQLNTFSIPSQLWKLGTFGKKADKCCRILGVRNWKCWRNRTCSTLFPYCITHLFGFFQHEINICWYFQALPICSHACCELNTYYVLSTGLDFAYTKNNCRPVPRGAYRPVEKTSITWVNPQMSIYYKLWYLRYRK